MPVCTTFKCILEIGKVQWDGHFRHPVAFQMQSNQRYFLIILQWFPSPYVRSRLRNISDRQGPHRVPTHTWPVCQPPWLTLVTSWGRWGPYWCRRSRWCPWRVLEADWSFLCRWRGLRRWNLRTLPRYAVEWSPPLVLVQVQGHHHGEFFPFRWPRDKKYNILYNWKTTIYCKCIQGRGDLISW